MPVAITTVILHGLPSRKRLTDLVPILNSLGFGPDTYDYLYMPCRAARADRDRETNLGYAFLNFVSPEVAAAFSLAVHRHPLGRPVASCEKVFCGPAKAQGRAANLALLDIPLEQGGKRTCYVREGDTWHERACGHA